VITPVRVRPVPSGRRVVLTDGSSALVRLLDADDRAAVDELHRSLPPDDRYRRFFSVSATGPRMIADVVVADDVTAVGAFAGGRLLGVAHFRREPPGTDPEVAMAVAHPAQHRGVGSLLLEHLVAAAVEQGVTRLTATVLAANHDMLRVFHDSGIPLRTVPDGTEIGVELLLDRPDEDYPQAVLERGALADVASLSPVLAPRSVVVVGAGRRPDSVGRIVLRSIGAGGFTGPVHVVSRHAATVEGHPAVPTVAGLPEGVDLAVLCVPAAAVPEVAEECGRRGVRALLVITAGITSDPGHAAALASAVERYGMRMVGPNCLGLVDTDPAVALQATFGRPVTAGEVGVAAQSGGVVIAVTAELDRLGLGASTVVSTGDSVDVNADDMLLWWAQDGRTSAAVLYVESLRRPRMFAALARRLARRMPVLTVRSGSSEAGRLAAASHSAGSATPRVVRDALFAQAGVVAVDELTELPGLLALLCRQPLPAGPRVAVLSNAGGAGVLAADACVRAGLDIANPGPATRAELTALLPATAAVGDPVDTTATVPAAVFARALELLLADPGVDAVLALGASTGAGDPLGEVAPVVAAGPGKPVVLVRLGQPEAVTLPPGLHAGDLAAPAFAEPAAAARALAAAVRRESWLRRPSVAAPAPQGVDPAGARAVVARALAERDEGGWLDPTATGELAAAAGLPAVATTVVHSAEAAVRRWRAIGGPVAVKADVPGVLHKRRAGGVATGLDSRREVGRAVREFRERFGRGLRGVVVQPMVADGVELLLGVTVDPLCGPLLTLGLGGSSTDLVDDRTHCLVPATLADLDDLLDGLHAAPGLLDGGGPGLRTAVRDVACRLAWLAQELPEIAEAEINPLTVGDGGAVAVDVRIRVAHAAPAQDPWLRRLPL